MGSDPSAPVACIEQRVQQLQDDPNRLSEIEQQIDQHYRRGGGQFVASICPKHHSLRILKGSSRGDDVKNRHQLQAAAIVAWRLADTASAG